MRLLMISGDRAVLQGKKGAFWYTLEEFAKHWDRIDVITPRAAGDKGERTFFGNVHFHPNPGGLLSQPRWILRKGKELVAEHGHQVMTVHEYPPFYNGLGARRLSKAAKIPAMVEIHHVVGYPTPASFAERIGYRLSRWWIPGPGSSYAKAVRVVSAETEKLLKEWGVAAPVRLLSSVYLDPSRFASLPPADATHDVAFCARLVANKGLRETIEAVAGIPGATLLVIGDGPERRPAEELARRLAPGRVTFAGWLASQDDVYRAIRSAKVFVMHSKSEGGPRVLFEAMALGMPVVSTRVGRASEIVEHDRNGLLSDGSPETLRAHLVELLVDDARRARLGEAARAVLNAFRRDVVVAAYAKTLQSLA